MTLIEAILLFGVALLAGALNSVAGGGSFLSFPTLLFTGVPPINANATNTMALWPGSLASVGAYRKELGQQKTLHVALLIAVSLFGGLSGAELLLRTPKETFTRLIPFLLLMATLLFTFGGAVTKRLRARLNNHNGEAAEHIENPSWLAVVSVLFLQLFIAIYGGYFGGGIGIMMLASLSLLGMTHIHSMNALKTVLASAINGIAVVRFIIAGTIFWPQAVVMVVGAILGGYGGAALAQKIDPKLVRRFVIVIGFTMTLYFFVRTYLLT
jgi:uncharacterized membrane protein YfcA